MAAESSRYSYEGARTTCTSVNLIGEDGYLELWARMHLLSEAVNAGCMKKLNGYYPELDQYYEVGRAGIKREQQCAA